MRELKFSNPEELKRQIDEYFEMISEPDEEGDKRPPTLSGLALHLGTTRRTLTEYINAAHNDDGSGKKARCGELLVMAKARIECYLEEKLISGYSKGLEFVLQNGYHGWGSKQQVTVSGGMDVKHEGEVKTKLTDEELLNQIAILTAKADEIRKREGC